MDKKVNKQAIVDEYLLGCFTYRELEKKHGVSRQAINEWVLDYQGIPRIKTIRREQAKLQVMKGKNRRKKWLHYPSKFSNSKSNLSRNSFIISY